MARNRRVPLAPKKKYGGQEVPKWAQVTTRRQALPLVYPVYTDKIRKYND